MSAQPASSSTSSSIALCDGIVSTRRGLLALLWSLVMMCTGIAFLTAMFFAIGTDGSGGWNHRNNDDDKYQQQQQNQQQDEDELVDPEMAVTSRAMVFAALWTAVLAALLSVFGTVILGYQSPTGQYYTCCSASVFRTTPLGVGSFIGVLIMFANLTLVCSILFGEFQVRDYQREENNGGNNANGTRETFVERSSVAFSVMCMFLTILYASFAALTFVYSAAILEEHDADAREEILSNRKVLHYNGYDGYIGERFDVLSSTRRLPDIGERFDVRRIPGNTFVTNPNDGIV